MNATPTTTVIYRHTQTGRLMALDGGSDACSTNTTPRFWWPATNATTFCKQPLDYYRVGAPGVPDRDGFWGYTADHLHTWWREVTDPQVSLMSEHVRSCADCLDIAQEDADAAMEQEMEFECSQV